MALSGTREMSLYATALLQSGDRHVVAIVTVEQYKNSVDNATWAKIKKAASRSKSPFKQPSADTITQPAEKSNSKFSETDTDSAGASLSKGQRSYFADSKVRDAQDRLKVMYRGGNGDYTVFDRRKSAPSNVKQKKQHSLHFCKLCCLLRESFFPM